MKRPGRINLTPSNALLLTVAVCATVGAWLLNGEVFEAFDASSRVAVQRQNSRDLLKNAQIEMYRAHTHALGYIAEGIESSRSAFTESLGKLRLDLHALQELLATDPIQSVRLRKLGEEIEQLAASELSALNSLTQTPSRLHSSSIKTIKQQSALDTSIEAILDRESSKLSEQLHERDSLVRAGRDNAELLTIVTAVILIVSGFLVHRYETRVLETQKALEDARKRAEDANDTKSSFLANISHEIRTPMTAILGYTELLLDPDQTAMSRMEYVRTIRRNGEYLLQVINDLLDLSKIEAGKIDIETTKVQLPKVLAEVTSLMGQRAQQKGLSMTVNLISPIPAWILSDALRIRQILINLIGNAIKFTESGEIAVNLSSNSDRVHVAVCDSGVGMSGSELARLFIPFSQADVSTSRKYGGTGLGLSISKRLACLLGGNLHVESTKGRGSIFTLDLPRANGSIELLHALTKECNEAVLPEDPVNQLKLEGRILLVEDNPDNQRLIKHHLTRAGLDVEVVDRGTTAVARALSALEYQTPFDLILMDMQMPEMDGVTATALLRSKGYSLPIVALSANSMAKDRERCAEAGCQDFIAKPLYLADFFSVVSKYVRGGSRNVPTLFEMAAADSELKEILNEFVVSLPSQIVELGGLLQKHDFDGVENLAHQLVGACGSYGFPHLTDVAREIQLLARTSASTEMLSQKITELRERCERLATIEPRTKD